MDSVQCIFYVEINLIGLTILLVLFLFGRNHGKGQREQQAFSVLLAVSAIMLISDTGTWVFDGAQFSGAEFLAKASSTIFYLSSTFVGPLWLIYCDGRLIKSTKKIIRRYFFYFLPWLIGAFLIVASLWTGWIFYFDAQNVYHRGNLFFLHALLNLAYLLASFALVISAVKNLNKVRRQDGYWLLLFLLLPTICVGVQSLFYGISIVPVSITISLLITFVQRQSSLITIDNLTGLNNHRAFETHMEQRIRSVPRDQRLFMLMIDADHFKQINDTYGHAVGNEALVDIAYVLRKSCGKGDFLARLGGDEFVLAGQRGTAEEIKELVKIIQKGIERKNQSNQSNKKGYHLSLSIGSAVYSPSMHGSLDLLLREADNSMYNEKRRRKRNIG